MKKIIFILSFFSYSGFYVGIAFLFAFNLSELSRFYSIPLRVLLAILMLWVIKKEYNNLIDVKKRRLIVTFLMFWVLYFLKVLYTENVSTVTQTSKPWYEFIFFSITYVILPFITFMSIDYTRYKFTILNAFILSGFLLGLANLYIYGGALGTGIARVSELTYKTGDEILSPLALSYSGSLTIVLCVYKLLIIKNNNKKQIIYLISTIILAFIMFLLGSSRGSVIAIAFSIMVFLGYSPTKNKIQLIILTAIITPAIIWAIEISGSGVFSRFADASKDGGGGRIDIWSKTVEHFLNNPIFGGKVEINGIYPHNFILEILMATGVVGAIIILPLLFKTFIRSRFLSKDLMFMFLIFIQGIALHLLSGSLYTATLVFLPMGFILIQDKFQKENT